MIKIASWNVNGIRACHKAGFIDWVASSKPDLIGLQEVRAEEVQISKEILDHADYHKAWFAASSKKGYSGVAILSRVKPLAVHYGMEAPEFDAEGRAIAAEFKELVFISAYFPNSQDGGRRIDYKIAFCKRIHVWAEALRKKTKKPVVICGDYNIAHEEIDLARPDSNHESPGFLPAERAWMTEFLKSGWIDTFRYLHPDKVQYSWWSARTRARERNIGWRIDYHAVHKDDVKLIKGASIEDQQLGSDHCPVILNFAAKL